MPLLTFTILIIFGLATSQNHDGNSQTPYRKVIGQRSVEASTPIPPAPRVADEGLEVLLTRLENLRAEKLISGTNKRFQSLEYQSLKVHSPADGNREKLLDNLTPEVPINENLEIKVENLSKDIQSLKDAVRILSSNMEAVQRNVSSLINDTRSIFINGLQEQKKLQIVTSTSLPLNCTREYPRNCREVREFGNNASGIYMLMPKHAPTPFQAVCELETRGGNWTVIQRRYDGSQDFYLGWNDYKNGFGNLTGEFWLGLEHIHLLTGYEDNEILIELGDAYSHNKSAFYSQFTVGSEIEKYSLKNLGTYAGDVGDSMRNNVGSKFSTKDLDTGSCARTEKGAWWYNNCGFSNLNGKYLEPGQIEGFTGVYWYHLENNGRSLKHTRMLVRPKV